MFAHLQKRFDPIVFVLVLLLSLLCTTARAETTDWSVAVIDRILAAVPSGGTLARVGDMQIQTSLLKRWRDQISRPPRPNLLEAANALSRTGPYTGTCS